MNRSFIVSIGLIAFATGCKKFGLVPMLSGAAGLVLLACLLAPRVHGAREAARRTQCRNILTTKFFSTTVYVDANFKVKRVVPAAPFRPQTHTLIVIEDGNSPACVQVAGAWNPTGLFERALTAK